MEQAEQYLRSTYSIDCEDKEIRKKVVELTGDENSKVARAKRLFYFVRDEIKYNPYLFTDVPDAYRASKVLEVGEGFCIQKAVLLAALARTAGIPSRLRFADIRNNILPDIFAELDLNTSLIHHGYDELYIEGKWIKATPAFDLWMCEANHIIPVEFDGIHNGTFHSHNRDGQLHIEYIQDHGHYDDLPFDKMMEANLRVYGADYLEKFKTSGIMISETALAKNGEQKY
ncbi:MAG: transglutaminase family protein [Thermodesulfobacteriota bacterium]|nr:transglutaminase family protein [Thermodesulfobacteriota bacterium]